MTLFLAKEPKIDMQQTNQPFYQAFWIPLQEFFQRKGVIQAIGFFTVFCFYISSGILLPQRYKPNLFMIWGLAKRI